MVWRPAHVSWARTADRTARTEPGRKGFLARFEREADPDGVLPEDERARRAEHARKAYMQSPGRGRTGPPAGQPVPATVRGRTDGPADHVHTCGGHPPRSRGMPAPRPLPREVSVTPRPPDEGRAAAKAPDLPFMREPPWAATSSRSTAGSATNASTSISSGPWPAPGSPSPTGRRDATTTGGTQLWAANPSPLRCRLHPPITPGSHRTRINSRGPVTYRMAAGGRGAQPGRAHAAG